jgi:hypothetical protein
MKQKPILLTFTRYEGDRPRQQSALGAHQRTNFHHLLNQERPGFFKEHLIIVSAP